MLTQNQREWCWAAACATINNYFAEGVFPKQQCDIANLVFNATDCCIVPDEYDLPWYLDQALASVHHIDGVQIAGSANAMGGFTALEQEIGVQQEPIAVRYSLPDGGYHFVVIYGYNENDGSFVVWDPAGRAVSTNFSDWTSDFGPWVDTYFTIG